VKRNISITAKSKFSVRIVWTFAFYSNIFSQCLISSALENILSVDRAWPVHEDIILLSCLTLSVVFLTFSKTKNLAYDCKRLRQPKLYAPQAIIYVRYLLYSVLALLHYRNEKPMESRQTAGSLSGT
jgi:hypothetical protein